MRRSLSIAMMVSVAIHAAAFAIANLLLRDVAAAGAPLVLNVTIRQAKPIPEIPTTVPLLPDTAIPPAAAATSEVTEIAVRSITPTSSMPVTVTETALDSSIVAEISQITVARSYPASKSLVQETDSRPAFAPQRDKVLMQSFDAWSDDIYQALQRGQPLDWNYEGQEYLVTPIRLDSYDDTEMPGMVVQVSTTLGETRLTTEVHLQKLAFSSYAQFVNRWNPDVYFHDDRFDGRFHSNSQINLAYERDVAPQFLNKVTTTARRVNIDADGTRPDRDRLFPGGLETGADAIPWPKEPFRIPNENGIGENRIHHFDTNTRITFNADGTYSWEAVKRETSTPHVTSLGNVSYLVAARKATLYVSGTVSGKVLVYSPRRIVIEGDLTYARDPVRYADSGDFLGLVSDRNIEIAPASFTGPGDLAISAALFARQKLTVRGYRSRAHASLLIYGSLTAGSMSATEPRYNTRIRFDKRLESRRPPGFPVTSQYVVEFWDHSWQAESDPELP